ncbi:MAG: proprotein convertase P-domain-containing protein [Planctomycetes bacterium]|nr:proprotein convertase P-domain-containing protein [Planctomycetota bacterium]
MASIFAVFLPAHAAFSQDPDVAFCDAPALGISGAGPSVTTQLEVSDLIAPAAVEVFLDISAAWTSYIAIASVESPGGTVVTLHDGSGGFGSDFSVTYLDEGEPNDGPFPFGSGVTSFYDCNGCFVQPADPAGLEQFAEEPAAGTWTLAIDSTSFVTLNEWCVGLYATAPPPKVGDLVCAASGAGAIDLTWTNRASYDSIDVFANGELEATLAGPFDEGTIGSYLSPPMPIPQMAEISVVAYSAIGGASLPNRCEIGLHASPAASQEILPLALISSELPTYYAIFLFPDSLMLEDLQVDVAVDSNQLGNLDVKIGSPSGTEVTLHDRPDDNSAKLDVRYWDIAPPYWPPYDCACFMRPSGPGALRDFVDEDIAGIWVVSVESVSSMIGIVERVAIRGYDLGPAFAVGDLTCAQGTGFDTAAVSWTNRADYDEIAVVVDGILVAMLAGPFATGESIEFESPPQALPSSLELCVQGFVGGAGGPATCCNLDLFIPPIASVACFAQDGSGTIAVSWLDTVGYDSVNLYVDGVLEANIDGGEESYTTGAYAVPGTMEVCMEGIVAEFEPTVTECCTAMLLESATAAECVASALDVPGAAPATESSIELFDIVYLDEVEVIVDIDTANIRPWNIAVTSPAGTEIKLYKPRPGSAPDMALTFDDAGGVPHGSLPFDCACAMETAGPGSLEDFAGELSNGEWTLTLSSNIGGVLDGWCIRVFGCPLAPPAEVACALAGESVTVTWSNVEAYDNIDVLEWGCVAATIAGTDTSYSFAALPGGRHRYSLRAHRLDLGCGSQSGSCDALVGPFEACREDIDLIDGSPGATYVLEFPELIIANEVEVVLQMDGVDASNWDFLISSPAGTQVQLHHNQGGTADFDVTWSDLGTPVLPSPGFYACDGCLVRPFGPGELADFVGENGGGAWTLTTGDFSPQAVLDLWCVRVFQGCIVVPPDSVACSAVGDDIELTWVNPDTYDAIEVMRNGQPIATLAGTDTSVSDPDLFGGAYTYRVFGSSVAAACGSGSLPCLVEHRVEKTCDAPMDSNLSDFEEFAIVAATSMRLNDVEIFLHATDTGDLLQVLNGYSFGVESPSGTQVTLADGRSGLGENIVATFSGAGSDVDDTTTLDCGGCRLRPSGPGTLADFRSEPAAGTWTLSVATTFIESVGLDEWCLYAYEGCTALPPESLTCSATAGGVSLEWTNPESYDTLSITRDDLVIATLAGDASSYLDAGSVSGHLAYHVFGYSAAATCSSRSHGCTVDIGFVQSCDEPAAVIPRDSEIHAATIEVSALNAAPIRDCELFIDVATDATGDWSEITVRSPAGTTVQVHAGGGAGGNDFLVTFSDGGARNTGMRGLYSCAGCLIAPSGPGAFADLAEESANGIWTLEMITSAEGTLNSWCLSIVYEDAPVGPFMRGDASGDGIFNALLDMLTILNFFFNDGPEPPCLISADADGDGVLGPMLDAIYLLQFQFNAGPAPPSPGPYFCGSAPDPGGLGCDESPAVCDP